MEDKAFWEWCGLVQIQHADRYSSGTRNWVEYQLNGVRVDEPKFDLNDLFKYAVPKLQDKGYQIDIVCFEHKHFDVAIFNVIHDESDIYHAQGGNLAQTLRQAIEKVIEQENQNER